MRWHTSALAVCASTALSVSGCPQTKRESDNAGRVSTTQLRIDNVAKSPIRIGVDQSATLGPTTATSGDAGVITDLTPLLEPGESFDLPISTGGIVTEVRLYAIPPEDVGDVRGPFTCRFDIGCTTAGGMRAVWTGAAIIHSGVNSAMLELANRSERTAFLLVGDETPAVPLLPLLPGESRFVAIPRAGTIAASVEVSAVVIDPNLGPRLAAAGNCGVLGVCHGGRVEFDGATVACEPIE